MNIATPVPTKTPRIDAYRTASWPHRVAMHDAIAAHKQRAISAWRALGRQYLAQRESGIVVPYERAVLAIQLEAAARARNCDKNRYLSERAL